MLLKKFSWCKILLISLFLSGAVTYGHPIKSSYSVLSINKAGQLELVIRFFKDDFSLFFRSVDPAFNMDDGMSTQEEKYILKYLRQKVVIYPNGKKAKLLEIADCHSEELTVTFFIPLNCFTSFTEITIQNEAFFEVFNDQSNVVQIVQSPERNYTIYLVNGYGTETVKF